MNHTHTYHIELEQEEDKEQNHKTVVQEKVKPKHHSKEN